MHFKQGTSKDSFSKACYYSIEEGVNQKKRGKEDLIRNTVVILKAYQLKAQTNLPKQALKPFVNQEMKIQACSKSTKRHHLLLQYTSS